MKNIKFTILLLSLIMAVSACVSQEETKTKCGSIMCTDLFMMIPVRLIATKSSRVDFKSYKVIDLKTGKEVKNKGIIRDSPGTLVIADDSNRKDFPESGENLQLRVTRKDDRVITADYKIGGGICACHVTKLAGPDQVDLDQ